MTGKGHLGIGDFDGDWQDRQAKIGDGPLDPPSIRQGKCEFPEADLDREFSDGADADGHIVGGVFQGGVGTSTEFARVVQCPDQRMGIEEMPHSAYSPKSSSGASKSGAIETTDPFIVPSRRGGLGGDCGAETRRATGRSFSVITTSSPVWRR